MNKLLIFKYFSILAIAICTGCGGDSNPEPEPDPGGHDNNPPAEQPYNLPAPLAEVVVDPTVRYQTFEGFGTSLAWFGNVIGGWPEPTRSEIADLLFDPEAGLGINIVRYNIGGGENPTHDHMRAGGEMDGFQPSEGVWDWSVDANQRWMLGAAKTRAGEHFIAEAFSNSPPYWMTYSRCAAGNDPGSANALQNDRYDDFAHYLTQVALYFRDEWGIHFRTIEPVNEPEADWWRAYNGQEGAHFDAAAQAQIIRALSTATENAGLEAEIAAMDAAGIGAAIDNYLAYDERAASSLDQLNAHGYHGNLQERNRLRNLAKQHGKRLWMSESDGGGAEDPFAANVHDPDAMDPGLDLAKRIYQVMRDMQPAAWVFWQAVENWPNQVDISKNWGLILADFHANGDSSQDYRTTKKYHVMAQYSKYIRPGYRMVQINDAETLAFVSDDDAKLIIVKTHPGATQADFEVDLSRFDTLPLYAQAVRTSAFENHQALADVPIQDQVLTATLPPKSVTTFEINLIAYSKGNPVHGEFRLINRNSDLCLTVNNPATANPLLVQSTCLNDGSQNWAIAYQGNGVYSLNHPATAKYAGVNRDAWEAGEGAVLMDGANASSQQWHLLDQGDGFFHIVNAQSLLLMDINGSSSANNAEALQWYDTGGTNQDWQLDMQPEP